jgi:ABC-type cobalt transport system substrate-binding protein
MIMQNKRLGILMLTTTILLLIPLVAMQFTNEVNWNLFDFFIAGVLLIASGLMIELVLRKTNKIKHKIIIVVLIIIIFLLIWAELAVGIFGGSMSGH